MACAVVNCVFYIIAISLLLLSGWQTTHNAEAANILGLFTSHSPSHLIVDMSIVKALAEKGHNITVVTTQKPKITHENIHTIEVTPSADWAETENSVMTEMARQENTLWNSLKTMRGMMSLIVNLQVDVLRDPRFTVLYDNMKFDLVIVGYFINDFQLGVAAKFKCPVILAWTGPGGDLTNGFIGNPNEWSYVPNPYVIAGPVMNFGQRLQNFFGGLFQQGLRRFIEYHMEQHYNEIFQNDNIPPYKEMRKNVSLMYFNSHYSEGPIRPNVPAAIEIGGIQVKDKPNPLPKDIEAHINASGTHGAILFCLGSNVKSGHVKPEKVEAIFKALSDLKQNVVWKWDDLENLPGKSKNILYKKWIPQDDILAHPKLKLFITHAGKGGVAESQYHGVPMVALPIFADQNTNADKMVASGYGVQLKQLELTESQVKDAVNELLSNSTYRDNIQRFSKLYRDRPMTAKETVVYWSEYVMRHHGASHMQSPLVHMSLIQAVNLDVLFLVFIALVISILLLKYVFSFVCTKLFKKIKSKKVKQQ